MTKDDVFWRIASFVSKMHSLESTLAQLTREDELSTLQFNLLNILYFSGPTNLSALSECMNMNLPNSSREVKRLCDAGLVKKSKSSQDKRITDLSLTDPGRKKVEGGLNLLKESMFASSGDWDESRINRFLESLTILEEELFP